MRDTGTGWELNKRKHFDEFVVNYDRIRPEYPGELFEDVFKYSESEKGKKALEIGAGTGKATTPFLDMGYDVTTVEVGANMAEFLLEKFKRYKEFKVIVSAFEDALLEEDSYDLIYVASAFHWVEAEIGCPKAFRLLKNGGTIALLRYNAIPADGEERYEEIQAVYDKYYYSYYKSNTRPVRRSKEEFMESSKIIEGYGFEDLRRYGFRDVLMKLYDVTRIFSANEYIAFLDTLADHRSLSDDDRAALYTGIKEAILRHGGCHKVDYVFQLYMGRKL